MRLSCAPFLPLFKFAAKFYRMIFLRFTALNNAFNCFAARLKTSNRHRENSGDYPAEKNILRLRKTRHRIFFLFLKCIISLKRRNRNSFFEKQCVVLLFFQNIFYCRSEFVGHIHHAYVARVAVVRRGFAVLAE